MEAELGAQDPPEGGMPSWSQAVLATGGFQRPVDSGKANGLTLTASIMFGLDGRVAALVNPRPWHRADARNILASGGEKGGALNLAHRS